MHDTPHIAARSPAARALRRYLVVLSATERAAAYWDEPAMYLAWRTGIGRIDVLLRGDAIEEGRARDDRDRQSAMARQVRRLVGKGLGVYYVAEDAAARGLRATDLVPGLSAVPERRVSSLIEGYAQVWHW